MPTESFLPKRAGSSRQGHAAVGPEDRVHAPAGVLEGAAGAVLYWMGRKEAAAARLEQPPVTIAPRPDGATLLWRRTF